MNPGPEWGEQDEPPIADLVAESFHDDRAIGGKSPGGVAFLGDVPRQVGRGPGVEPVSLCESRSCLLEFECCEFSGEGAEGPSGLYGAPQAVAAPEGQSSGWSARGRNHDHSVGGDVRDLPGG